MRKQLVATFFTLALAFVPVLGAAEVDGVTSTKFDVLLSPSHEYPPLENVDASGKATIEFNVKRTGGEVTMVIVDFHVVWRAGQPEELKAMMIHKGAAGMNGGIVINAGLGEHPTMRGGVVFQQVKIMDPAGIDTVMEIIAYPGDFYLNVHSVSNPPGLVRGQLDRDPAARLKMVEGNLQRQLDQIQETLNLLANFVL